MKCHILGTTKQAPDPVRVAEMLRQSGYDAKLENVSGHAATSLAFELRYAPNRLPIVVKIGHDLLDDPDEADYEYDEWLEELLEDRAARSKIRRWIFVHAFDNADTAIVQAVVHFMQTETAGIAVSQD